MVLLYAPSGSMNPYALSKMRYRTTSLKQATSPKMTIATISKLPIEKNQSSPIEQFTFIMPTKTNITPGMKALSTTKGYCSGAKHYSRFAALNGFSNFEDIAPPTTDAEHCQFKHIVHSFATYMSQMPPYLDNPDKTLEPSSCKENFTRFWNAMIKQQKFNSFLVPHWYQNMCGDVKKRADISAMKVGSSGKKKNKRVVDTVRKDQVRTMVKSLITSAEPSKNSSLWTDA